MGIRAIERFSGLHRDTVLSILETAGEKCARLLDEKIRNVKCSWVEVDEIHGFVFSKEERNIFNDPKRGDMFTYLGTDAGSKLIINWRTSKRNVENTTAFIQDLKNRIAGRFQLTTDAYAGYCRGASAAVQNVFGNAIDYATEMKVFANRKIMVKNWFAAPRLIEIKRYSRIGKPDMKLATTCHAERTNLSVRIFTRRFTRKTLGYSKKLENLRHAVAIFAAHFNFVRKHSAHGRTPAQAANLTDHAWTIEEMLAETQ